MVPNKQLEKKLPMRRGPIGKPIYCKETEATVQAELERLTMDREKSTKFI